ncbi:Cu/Ag efflux protein CusF [Pseudoduganella flava]|uniref:Cu/Ag efflux protein CusF n=1 Tax=Pseudoduganella flava TaxID=871742 RepID=A0A562PKF2_9BURK|nr:copper-binding protein [Pseudoduganella flava]QGZ42368.1 RND transporter [Pseudoduganella flava]TWI44931.1 Cu/Ag efflux protein CusF [Pseudoduganella flava]
MSKTHHYLAAALIGLSATVQGPAAHAQQAASAPAADTALTGGEIKKVDKEAGKVTIQHGELRNLGMPAMTMVFRVRDRAMLDKVRQGDKVRFRAERVDGALAVTAIEKAE